MDVRPITVLAGGVGAARFLQGLLSAVPAEDVAIIGNVGDDLEVAGLHVSPDLDTVLYTLTGWIDETRGWGVRGDSDRALDRARSLGAEAWFWLGDLDIGLHMARTERLARGEPLSAATAVLAEQLGLGAQLLPVTDDRLRTMLQTQEGELDFQTYYVRRGHRDRVTGLRFDGAGSAAPAPGVLEALRGARVVIVAPSNPLISIGPILAVPGVREALAGRAGPTVAVSPIVGGTQRCAGRRPTCCARWATRPRRSAWHGCTPGWPIRWCSTAATRSWRMRSGKPACGPTSPTRSCAIPRPAAGWPQRPWTPLERRAEQARDPAVAVRGRDHRRPTTSAGLLAAAAPPLIDGDVVVVSHKAVSKWEGRVVDLATVEPSDRAVELAGDDGDPRHIELVLRESRRIVRRRGSLLIARPTTASSAPARASTARTHPAPTWRSCCPPTRTPQPGPCGRRSSRRPVPGWRW